VKVPMHCTHGDDNQTFSATVTAPASRPPGAVLHLRIDGTPSGEIKHIGLHYLHDMATDYTLPTGATYVEGSARLVAGTGTANVLPKASLQHQGRKLRLLLPAHVENGTSYTPPSFEFELRLTAPAGKKVSVQFSGYRLVANAAVAGDVVTTCVPVPTPYPIATVRVGGAAAR